MQKIIPHGNISIKEGFTVISRMYYRPAKNTHSVFLSFENDTDLFKDSYDENGNLFFYRGIDTNDKKIDPKKSDQSLIKKTGSKSMNSIFQDLVKNYKVGSVKAEVVHLYRKIATNKWTDEGNFELIDCKFGNFPKGNRKIFVFTLRSIK